MHKVIGSFSIFRPNFAHKGNLHDGGCLLSKSEKSCRFIHLWNESNEYPLGKWNWSLISAYDPWAEKKIFTMGFSAPNPFMVTLPTAFEWARSFPLVPRIPETASGYRWLSGARCDLPAPKWGLVDGSAYLGGLKRRYVGSGREKKFSFNGSH